jgi:hypothetical protein
MKKKTGEKPFEVAEISIQSVCQYWRIIVPHVIIITLMSGPDRSGNVCTQTSKINKIKGANALLITI